MASKTKVTEGRFPKNYSMCVNELVGIKGSLAGKEVLISIDFTRKNNYVSIEFANQLVIPESNITEANSFNANDKQYNIDNLHPSIGEYSLQFTVKTLFSNNSDIVLGSLWMESLGSFILQKEENNAAGC